jgi:release factor glutamine methyltransferase
MNEAELVFTEVLKCSRASLYIDKEKRITPEAGRVLSGILKRRSAGEPLSYILGKIDFMGFEFRVTPDCLVPRPETELVVETVISNAQPAPGFTILDIGTGSGCIAISLAKMLANARIIATDISDAALVVARDNARRLGVQDRIHFIAGDLFPPASFGRFDCVVSNPPYIRTSVIDGLSAEVRAEPRIALDGGPDGLLFYRRIIGQADRYLSNKGTLIMEIGFDQPEDVLRLIDHAKKYKVKEVIMDYNGIHRIVAVTKD